MNFPSAPVKTAWVESLATRTAANGAFVPASVTVPWMMSSSAVPAIEHAIAGIRCVGKPVGFVISSFGRQAAPGAGPVIGCACKQDYLFAA